VTNVDAVLAELEAALLLADASATPITPAMLAAFVRNLRMALARSQAAELDVQHGHLHSVAPVELPTPESEAPKDPPSTGGLRTCTTCDGAGSRIEGGVEITCDDCEGIGAV
jgi:hypothetical protein